MSGGKFVPVSADPTMQLIVLPDAAVSAVRVAEIVADRVRRQPCCVLGLATGATMRPVYAHLARLHREGALSFAQATAFALDEYLGLPPDHPGSFATELHDVFTSRVDIDHSLVHLPRGDAPDPEAEARRYEAAIAAAGGIDLQLLGIGRNGHLAFNEPKSDFTSRTRVATLAEETRAANAAAFPQGEVPLRAITMGLGTILEARVCVLLATGAGKAEAIARMVDGIPGPDSPASALRYHRAATVVLDAAAAARLAPCPGSQ
jgi:glucosamine-6-phosphate deaminase